MSGVSNKKKCNYRVMGQDNFSLFLSMPKNFLDTHGTHVSISDLEMCLETIKEYNPWYPSDDNLMDMENWDWIQINMERRLLTQGHE